jgi:hypothetical protein
MPCRFVAVRLWCGFMVVLVLGSMPLQVRAQELRALVYLACSQSGDRDVVKRGHEPGLTSRSWPGEQSATRLCSVGGSEGQFGGPGGSDVLRTGRSKCALISEGELQRKLDDSGTGAEAQNFTEVGSADVADGVVPIRMIE